MKGIAFIVVLVVCCADAFGQNPNPSTDIDMAIANVMKEQRIPGVSTVIVREGELTIDVSNFPGGIYIYTEKEEEMW